MIDGLLRATLGALIVEGAEIREPSLDRAVVFQTPCLLPWLTARQNVGLALKKTGRDLQARVEHYFDLVGIRDAADQMPAALSLGTQQCVSLIRALSLE